MSRLRNLNINEVPVKELPDVTAADNGKVLMVVNGEWAVSSIPAELPSVTSADNGKVLGVVEGVWAVSGEPAATE